jgi:phosphatidylserine/phosphatidylglycerophosphate/cardiolipin synthase-like enzyme
MSLRWMWMAGIAAVAVACAAAEEGVPPAPPEPDEERLELPDCASDVSRAMAEAMVPVVDNGTVPLGRLSSAGRVDPRMYITGPEIFGKAAELIEDAEVEVDIQVYKWEPGTDPTETILGGLAALQARRRETSTAAPPVDVRIVIDTSVLGVAAPVTEEHMPLVEAQIAAYDLDPAHVRITLAAHERGLFDQFGNLHVKTFIVDGRVALITGANPEAQHNFEAPWHDIGTVVAGDVVLAMLDDFDHSYSRSFVWDCAAPDDCLQAPAPLEHRFAPGSTTAVASACHVLALSRQESNFPNNDVDNPQDQAFLAAFGAARRVLKIETPNINDDAAKNAIVAAVERGVEVRLITSKEFNEAAEGPVGGPNGDNVDGLYRRLASAGMNDACERLRIRWYSRDGIEPVLGNGPYASHVKYASVDDEVVIVGTTNMDTPSWNFSHELDLAIDDADTTRGFDAQLFDADWERAIDVDQCR